MPIPILFVLFVIFLFVFHFRIRSIDEKTEKKDSEFWEKEEYANSIRKKKELPLFHIDLEDVHFIENVDTDEENEILALQEEVMEFSGLPMMNCENKTNIDLKIEYGPSNLQPIIESEQNFIDFQKTILTLGKKLYDMNKIEESISILEKGVQYGSGYDDNYIILCNLYVQIQEKNRIRDLYTNALKNQILHHKKKVVDYIYQRL